MRHRRAALSGSATAAVQLDLEQAWKALALVNELVKQAEAKLGVVLATAGVTGGILFNLAASRP
jgi:hypothetical protein